MRLRDLLAGACVALTMLAVIPAASAEGDAQEIGAIDTSAIPATKHGKMTAEQRSIFYGAKEDPPAKELLGVNEDYAGRSYLAGDEWNLHLTHEHIKDSGGIYVGVGADQGYLLASWAQAEYAYLIDYDARVVLTHKIYRSFFLRSKTPKEFVALWKKSSTDKALVRTMRMIRISVSSRRSTRSGVVASTRATTGSIRRARRRASRSTPTTRNSTTTCAGWSPPTAFAR